MKEQEWRVVELFYDDGLKESEIAELEGINVGQVHMILYLYESGELREESDDGR